MYHEKCSLKTCVYQAKTKKLKENQGTIKKLRIKFIV